LIGGQTYFSFFGRSEMRKWRRSFSSLPRSCEQTHRNQSQRSRLLLAAFGRFSAAVIERDTVCDMTPCSPLEAKLRLGGTCPHLQGQIRQFSHATFMLVAFFDPEGGAMFLRKVGGIVLQKKGLFRLLSARSLCV
jgi:hypothetical protein